MEIKTSEEARANVEEFSKRFLELSLQKKAIDADIKAIKEEYKEEGVPVAIVAKAINNIKADKKKSDSELFELDTIKEWIQANSEIDDQIGELVAK